MGFNHTSQLRVVATATTVLGCLILASGCLNLRGAPIDLPPDPVPSHVPNFEQQPEPDRTLSGALDGPTLRLALRDLAVILDTLGRLERVHPELKQQMLRELADADATTAAAVVSQWRARLPALQARAESLQATPTPIQSNQHCGVAKNDFAEPAIDPASTSPTASSPGVGTQAGTAQPTDASADAGRTSPADATYSLDQTDLEPELPSWDDLLDSLVGMTRERSEELGPDATRARMQLALLELVRRSQDNDDGTAPDPQLWTHLDPAIQYCFGSAPPNQPPPQEVVRSLQVATELLRGPRRFQVRGLAFCTRIRGYGNVDRVQTNAFTPGQNLLLYSEVEHFFSDAVPGGFRTRIASVIELLDATGRVAWSQDFGAIEDVSSGPRRDYFLSYRFHLPNNLKSGVYSVRLTLTDELANRTASSAIALSIRN